MSYLRPTKHTNLQYSVLNISANILKLLKENVVIEYAELLDVLKQKIGEEVNEVFLLSLSLGLFLNYINDPNNKTVFVYPTPDNIANLQFKDKSDKCFSFKAKQVMCPKDENKLKVIK